MVRDGLCDHHWSGWGERENESVPSKHRGLKERKECVGPQREMKTLLPKWYTEAEIIEHNRMT